LFFPRATNIAIIRGLGTARWRAADADSEWCKKIIEHDRRQWDQIISACA